ncbi:membrane protein [Pseudonocardia yuanmonensis]|uniref:Membrane protein n=1 Tax=Pseudonocardia yuanmonensis TaxID=1095914 RepID=A0ABP8X5Z3_9PSEU
MSTVASPAVAGFAPALRRLYFVRFGFALVWAALVVVAGQQLGPVAAVLLVLYPLFDVAAAVVDARASKTDPSSRGLYLNIAMSLLAAIGLGIAATSGVPAVLRVWGAWAIVAGLIQLVVALRRRTMGGQWPMILSGGISVLAGASFALMAGQPAPSLVGIAGYATLGGIFFLASALRLGRAARTTTTTPEH